MAKISFSDDGVCQAFKTKGACLQKNSFDPLQSRCEWKALHRSCIFNNQLLHYLPSISLILEVTLLVIPLNICVSRALDITANVIAPKQSSESSYVRTVVTNAMYGVQRKHGVFMGGARLATMQNLMDHCPARTEAAYVARPIFLYLGTDRKNFLKTLVPSRKFDWDYLDVNAQFYRVLEKRLDKARQQENFIKEELELIEDDHDKEVFILRRFLMDALAVESRSMASKFFFKTTVHFSSFFEMFCLVSLIAYLLGITAFIFYAATSIGQNGFKLWIRVFIVAIVFENSFFKILRIWVKHVVFPFAISAELRTVHATLRLRATSILNRTNGMMATANCLVHHFNAACRACRAYPHLSMSRLLISMNDFDLSPSVEYQVANQRYLRSFLYHLARFTMLPEMFQDLVLDALCNAGFYILVICFAGLWRKSKTGMLAMGSCLLSLMIFVGCWYGRKSVEASKDSERSMEEILPFDDIDNDLLSGDERLMLYRKRWLSKTNESYAGKGRPAWVTGIAIVNRELKPARTTDIKNALKVDLPTLHTSISVYESNDIDKGAPVKHSNKAEVTPSRSTMSAMSPRVKLRTLDEIIRSSPSPSFGVRPKPSYDVHLLSYPHLHPPSSVVAVMSRDENHLEHNLRASRTKSAPAQKMDTARDYHAIDVVCQGTAWVRGAWSEGPDDPPTESCASPSPFRSMWRKVDHDDDHDEAVRAYSVDELSSLHSGSFADEMDVSRDPCVYVDDASDGLSSSDDDSGEVSIYELLRSTSC